MWRNEIYMLTTAIIAIVLWIIAGLAVRKIFIRQGENGKLAFVPILRGFLLYAFVWGNGYLYFLSLLPVSGLIIRLFTYIKLAKIYNKSVWMGIGLFLYPFIFFHLLIRNEKEVEITHQKLDRKVFWSTVIPGGSYMVFAIVSLIIFGINHGQHQLEREARFEAHLNAVVASIANGEWGIIPVTDGIEQTVTIEPYTEEEVEHLLESLFFANGDLNLSEIAQLMNTEQVYFGGLEWATLVRLMGGEPVSYYDLISIAEEAYRRNDTRQMQLVMKALAQEYSRKHMGYVDERAWGQPIGEEEWARRRSFSRRATLLTFLGELEEVRIQDFDLEYFVSNRSSSILGNMGIVYQGVQYRVATYWSGGTLSDIGHVVQLPSGRVQHARISDNGITIIKGFTAEVVGISRLNRWIDSFQFSNHMILSWLNPSDEFSELDYRIFTLLIGLFENQFGARGEATATPNGPRITGISLETPQTMIAFAAIEHYLGYNREEAMLIDFYEILSDVRWSDRTLRPFYGFNEDTRDFRIKLTRFAKDNYDVLYEQFGEIYPNAFREDDDGEVYLSDAWWLPLEMLYTIIEMYGVQEE